MRVALVHELLTMKGGAERVLRIVAAMFPDAPIYTLLYDEQKLGDWFPKERVRTSFLQHRADRLPISRRYNHHLYLPWFPKAVETWDFQDFDVVISFSSAFVHGIITNGSPKHLSYIHSPARYLWDRTHDVQGRAASGFFGFLRHHYLSRVFHRLRLWDAEAAPRADVLLAASGIVKRRIESYWRRSSDVVYPPLDERWMSAQPKQVTMKDPHYFLVVSTLARYKHIDIAIAACEKLGVQLKIVGDGPDRRRLESLAGTCTEFYGYRNCDELIDLYGNAQAVIFPGDEDFGLVPLESMACGTPVIALRVGGALETIVEGRTGLFFDEPTPESLVRALQRYHKYDFSSDACRSRARLFSQKRFEQHLLDQLSALMHYDRATSVPPMMMKSEPMSS